MTEVAPEAVPEETLPTYAYAYVGLPGQAPRTVLDYSPLTIAVQLLEGEVWVGSDVLGEFVISADGAALVPLAPALDVLRQTRLNQLHRETATRFNLAPTDGAYVEALTGHSISLRAQINAASTAAQLEALDLSVGWPVAGGGA
ncbi:hypothetical protein EOE18_13810 [Novosphingobium umbonatum]|uniref:DUF4376 domain-containing protein n=1 Tax=Novosphingobium umbonatum TaxID=1908524 RepID=A0A437N1X7_9SPHN|nr:hypothetical protein [Novosphingobium umbonatum]RVU03928.1 hypothetical protein EOE18_13810 [Novosphingobium umbonatum]